MIICRLAVIASLFAVVWPTSNLVAQKADPSPSSAPTVDPGETSNGFYRNRFFGFSYRIRYGWLDRTDEMRDASTDPTKSTVLLSLFERPPLARGGDVNSAIIIAAESLSSYPGLKNAAQYFGPISEVTEAKGMKAVNEPYEFPVDGKPIYRRDYMKQISGIAMHQSTLAMLSRGYVLSFTFIGNSDEEVQELIEFLRFGSPAKVSGNSPKASK
jgi:hypothetical protein